MANIFVIDDEQTICWGLAELGKSMGHEVHTASSVEKALDDPQTEIDLVIVDVRLPGLDGLSGIAPLKQKWPGCQLIVITAYGNLTTAVTAIKNGAFDYIVKPFELDHVQVIIERALESKNKSSKKVEQLSNEILIGSSSVMNDVFKKIALAADSDASVLLQGESGTGKELAARAIHNNSDRSANNFVAVNIASLNPTLAESELFGHVKGAFTGATESKSGLLAHADGGTLFLDEIADIPENIQVKLLRALEQREFQPVGSTTSVQSDFRIISATHRDLAAEVDQQNFRHDLFFRVATFLILLPPLRERENDAMELANHFLNEFGRNGKRGRFSKEAIREIESRKWYGNVRELRNAIEQAAIVSRNETIFPDHLPSPIAAGIKLSPHSQASEFAEIVNNWTKSQFDLDDNPSDLYEKLIHEIEKPLFEFILAKNRGQFSAAARQLGIHRTTLRKKAETYGIAGD